MGPVVWPVKLEDANATPLTPAHLDPQDLLANREPMGNRAPRDSLVNPELRDPQGLRRNRNPSTAANVQKVDPELLDPLDLLDPQGRTEIRATLEPPENHQELEPLDPKELPETKVRLDPLDLLERMDSLDKSEPKDRLDRRDRKDRQVLLDPLDSLDRLAPEAAKGLLDLQDPLVNLEALESLGPKAHLEPRRRLETTPNTAHAPHVAESSRSRRADGFLPEVVDVSLLSLSYPVVPFSVVAMLLSSLLNNWKYYGTRYSANCGSTAIEPRQSNPTKYTV